eukprot:TRINITY_DN17311_c0_g1_i1.p2 TRINITY_DN17311_c0_g1~~TRINITY_DN17311_c0_g1_i1.p2  ORF type:complete len:103 (+),score=3.75 TRINITY_DN17311_c0_g1_i1:128-436(+)
MLLHRGCMLPALPLCLLGATTLQGRWAVVGGAKAGVPKRGPSFKTPVNFLPRPFSLDLKTERVCTQCTPPPGKARVVMKGGVCTPPPQAGHHPLAPQGGSMP